MDNWSKYYTINKQKAEAWRNYEKLSDIAYDTWKKAIKDIEQKYNLKCVEGDEYYEGAGLQDVGNFRVVFVGKLTDSKIKKIEKDVQLECYDFEITKSGGKITFDWDGL